MDDFDSFEPAEEPGPDSGDGSGPVLPGGVNLQTAATALLVVVIGAALWLFFVPDSDEPPDLATATPAQSGAEASGTAAPEVHGTVVGGGAASAEAVTSQAPQGSPPSVRATSVPTGASAQATGTRVAPAALAEGVFVRVTGTGADGLRYRYGPGTKYVTIRIVPDGEIMRIAGGPEQSDGFTWWRAADSLGNVGWAVEEFLVPTPAPAAWNPPAASPTFPADTGAPTTVPAAPTAP